jgi:hypothetical protein
LPFPCAQTPAHVAFFESSSRNTNKTIFKPGATVVYATNMNRPTI